MHRSLLFCTAARQGCQLAAMSVGVELLRLKRGFGRAAAVCSFFFFFVCIDAVVRSVARLPHLR